MRRLVILVTSLIALLTIHQPVVAGPNYDAFIFVSLSGGPYFPGTVFTPPPLIGGNAGATNSADANTPGQVQARATGEGTGARSIASSTATAIGFGLLSVPTIGTAPLIINVPITATEQWSLFASNGRDEGRAEASVNFQLLLDGALVATDRHQVIAGLGGTGDTVSAFDTVTLPLSVQVSTGQHILLFEVQAAGVATSPEPGTLLLLGSSLVGISTATWRRKTIRALS